MHYAFPTFFNFKYIVSKQASKSISMAQK